MRPLTVKQEKFCHEYIETGNASEAYRRSYNVGKMKPATIGRKAAEVMANGIVTAKIAELRAKSAKRHEVTVEWLTENYKSLLAKAIDQEKVSDARGVLDSLGKLHGLIIEKRQVSGNIAVNHSAEPISATASWIGTMLGRPEGHEIEASVLN